MIGLATDWGSAALDTGKALVSTVSAVAKAPFHLMSVGGMLGIGIAAAADYKFNEGRATKSVFNWAGKAFDHLKSLDYPGIFNKAASAVQSALDTGKDLYRKVEPIISRLTGPNAPEPAGP